MSEPRTAYSYRGKIIRWIDGDTAEIEIDVGFGWFQNTSMRLYGINTPELHSSDKKERRAAQLAKECAEQIAPVDSYVQVKTIKDKDKYGRYLAQMHTEAGIEVALELIRLGHGKQYFGGTRE